MVIRQARTPDIKHMQLIRNAVKENILSSPALVPDKDVENYITQRGKGWVCIDEGSMAGFCIADLIDDNIWALFVLPDMEGKGIGKKLQTIMLDWYFNQEKSTVWLSTQKDSRAERFYRLSGWHEEGPYGKNEIKFMMDKAEWQKISATLKQCEL